MWPNQPAVGVPVTAPAQRKRKFLGMPWWAWGLLVGGAALVVIALVATSGGSDDKPEFAYAETLPVPTGGVTFTDPQGDYTMEIDPSWESFNLGGVKEVEQWAVTAAPTDGFMPNVNVLTQSVPGIDLQEYIDLSLSNLMGLTLVGTTTLEVDGSPMGLFEFVGVAPGSTMSLHFLAIVVVADGEAILVTFTAPDPLFAELRPDIEPYMRTLTMT